MEKAAAVSKGHQGKAERDTGKRIERHSGSCLGGQRDRARAPEAQILVGEMRVKLNFHPT